MLRWVVALLPEARPWITHFGLTLDPRAEAFKVYCSARASNSQPAAAPPDVALIVAGPGKVNAAAATSYLHWAAGAPRHAVWLNVGIAGHRTAELGQLVWGHKIGDLATGGNWYPPRVFRTRCATSEIVTVDRVEHTFTTPAAYDMEAAGFYPTACRFATAELVHCFKVISDGPAADTRSDQLTPAKVEGLIAAQVGAIVPIVEELGQLSALKRQLAADPPGFAALIARHHFTASEKRQLERLLRQWQALAPDQPLPDLPASRGSAVLRQLAAALAALPVHL